MHRAGAAGGARVLASADCHCTRTNTARFDARPCRRLAEIGLPRLHRRVFRAHLCLSTTKKDGFYEIRGATAYSFRHRIDCCGLTFRVRAKSGSVHFVALMARRAVTDGPGVSLRVGRRC